MIMLRRGIPLLPQELIGYHLGLVIPTERKDEFWNSRYAEKPVVASGFGTQIQNEKRFGMQKALDALNIPLTFAYLPVSQIDAEAELTDKLLEAFKHNKDVLLCLNWGVLTDRPEKNWGHILAVDQMASDEIRLIDTDIGAKWKTFTASKIFAALKAHGDSNYGGLWIFEDSK